MDCLTTTNTYKINRYQNVGNVILIVEGAKGEFQIFKYIFNNLLKYDVYEKNRNGEKFKAYDEFSSKTKHSKISIINAENSNITDILDKSDYVEKTFEMLYHEYGIDAHNSRIYYIWDRDFHSNKNLPIIEDLIAHLNNAYGNDDYDIDGMLILSYAQLEAYRISHFETNTYKLAVSDYKKYVSGKYLADEMTLYTLLHAVLEMHNTLKHFNIKHYELDNFKTVNQKVYELEESFYQNNNQYCLLSFISIILLDLQIIVKDN